MAGFHVKCIHTATNWEHTSRSYIQVGPIEGGQALPVTAVISAATALPVRHAVQRAERSRLYQHLRELAGLRVCWRAKWGAKRNGERGWV